MKTWMHEDLFTIATPHLVMKHYYRKPLKYIFCRAICLFQKIHIILFLLGV